MNFEITATEHFRKCLKSLAKRHRSIKDDFEEFTNGLRRNPFQGDELSPGIRKIRMAIKSKGRGKSGGARVITYTAIISEENGKIYLMDLYDKGDYASVDVNAIKKMIDELDL